VTIWFSEDAVACWISRGTRRRSAQRRYSDFAIETALTLRLLFRLPLRRTEGFVASLLRMLDLDLGSPDHTTLSRRAKQLEIELPVAGKGSSIHLVVDSTGLQTVGHGPWAAAEHGGAGTRAWRKLHVGVDQDRVIVAEKITDSNVDDASVVPDLVDQISGDKKITRFTADGAYDQGSVYETFVELEATVVVPPFRTAAPSRRRTRAARARNRTVNRVRKIGRRRWKKETRYHRRSRVENTFFRFKRLFGGRLRSRDRGNQEIEARLGCKILNRMIQLGAPRFEPIRA